MEVLENRYRKLADNKIRIEEQLKTVEKQLTEHQAIAQKNWGTDDIGKLEELLQKVKSENEEKRSNYQKHLDAIESQLNSIQKDKNPHEATNDTDF
jgi:hypothetical protein